MISRHRSYLLIGVAFVIAFTYQGLYTTHLFHVLGGSTERARDPFYYNRGRIVTGILPESVAAGLRAGDRVLAIDGVPFTGNRVIRDRMVAIRPGETLQVAVRSRDASAHTVAIRMAPQSSRGATVGDWVYGILMYVVSPLICLIVGFVVATMRPTSRMAWLLLILLVCFSKTNEIRGWSSPLRLESAIFRSCVEGTLAIWLLLFGIYFPERWRLDRKLPWLKWLVIAPLVAFTVISSASRLPEEYSFTLSAQWSSWVRIWQLIARVCSVLAVAWGLIALAAKTRSIEGKDGLRRLRILWVGTSVSLTPTLALLVYAFLHDRGLFEGVPAWMAITASLLLTVFPILVAYTIVAHRAMEIDVGLRLGIQYLLVKRGLAFCRGAVLLAATFTLLIMVNGQHRSMMEQLKMIGGTAVLLLLLQAKVGRPLVAWLDRRFFCDQANAEMQLHSLATEVHHAPDQNELLGMVARRLTETLHSCSTHILLRHESAFRCAQIAGDGSQAEAELPMEASIVATLAATRQPTLAYREDPYSWIYKLPRFERQALDGMRTELLIPLAGKNGLVGLLSLGAKRSEEPYTKADMTLLATVAGQTSLEIEQFQLVAKLSIEISQREQLSAEKVAMQRMNEAKSTFLASMSHELRTPLNAILGYSDMLMEEVLENGMAHMGGDLRKINISARHLLEMINAVLDFSKIEAGRMELCLEQVQVPQMVEDVLGIVTPLVQAKQNQLRLVCPDDLGEIRSDVLKLRQCLVNLLSNAGKFTSHGEVSLIVERDGNSIVFHVKDTGAGISPHKLESIFEAFTQEDASTTRRYGGTGLGLTISRHFCQMMGGDITVASELGHGSTFSVRLPAMVQEVGQPA